MNDIKQEPIVEQKFAERYDWPDGTRFRCTSCLTDKVVYPARTIDPRWVMAYCVVCHKHRICDVRERFVDKSPK